MLAVFKMEDVECKNIKKALMTLRSLYNGGDDMKIWSKIYRSEQTFELQFLPVIYEINTHDIRYMSEKLDRNPGQ